MKSKIFLMAIGVFVAAMALGFTSFGRLPASPETATELIQPGEAPRVAATALAAREGSKAN
jgi:hypothetical protein